MSGSKFSVSQPAVTTWLSGAFEALIQQQLKDSTAAASESPFLALQELKHRDAIDHAMAD